VVGVDVTAVVIIGNILKTFVVEIIIGFSNIVNK